MFINTSKILFESKSQPFFPVPFPSWWCLSIRQRYFLKANHNYYPMSFTDFMIFINTSKILFESKSQPERPALSDFIDVYQYVKDTFWKQITTLSFALYFLKMMFINTSKILFESKSQLRGGCCRCSWWCLSIRQRYFLKANHNRLLLRVR